MSSSGYTAAFTGTWYQYDRELGELMPVRGEDVDLSRGPAFTAPGLVDADLDQGDVCDEEDCAPAAPVVDGRCGWCGEDRSGEWVQIGYVTDEGRC